jgi:hypothetical protein
VLVLVALTVGLVIWICGWAFGVKSFDMFMIAVALVVAAATARIAAPFVNKQLGRE